MSVGVASSFFFPSILTLKFFEVPKRTINLKKRKLCSFPENNKLVVTISVLHCLPVAVFMALHALMCM